MLGAQGTSAWCRLESAVDDDASCLRVRVWQNRSCGTVVLTSTAAGAYDIKHEIYVTRRVTVTGNPSTMPIIDASDASRAFRVKVRRGTSLLAQLLPQRPYRPCCPAFCDCST